MQSRLDTTYAIETPEGVAIALTPVGPFPRGLAWLLDLAIRIGMNLAFGLLLWLMSFLFFGVPMALWPLFAFALEWLYPIYFEMFHDGKTPGKKRMKLQVMMEDGTPIQWRASILRNLIRIADFLPLLYGFGVIASMTSPRFQRLGDWVAGTVVVDVTPDEAFVPEASTEGDAPPVALLVEEQRALVSLAEQLPSLSPSRAVELADNLQVLTGKTGEDGVAQLQRYAAWIQGGRS